MNSRRSFFFSLVAAIAAAPLLCRFRSFFGLEKPDDLPPIADCDYGGRWDGETVSKAKTTFIEWGMCPESKYVPQLLAPMVSAKTHPDFISDGLFVTEQENPDPSNWEKTGRYWSQVHWHKRPEVHPSPLKVEPGSFADAIFPKT